MHVTEVSSFVQKFHQFWNSGLTAHLDLDCNNGVAWVGLRVQLGHHPGPSHPHQETSSQNHRKPFSRRRERRAAERAYMNEKEKNAEKAVTENTEEVSNEENEEVSKENAEEASIVRSIEYNENEYDTNENVSELMQVEAVAAVQNSDIHVHEQNVGNSAVQFNGENNEQSLKKKDIIEAENADEEPSTANEVSRETPVS